MKIAATRVFQPARQRTPEWEAKRAGLLADTPKHCATCHCPQDAARCPLCHDMGGDYAVNPDQSGYPEPPAVFEPCPNGCPVRTMIL